MKYYDLHYKPGCPKSSEEDEAELKKIIISGGDFSQKWLSVSIDYKK